MNVAFGVFAGLCLVGSSFYAATVVLDRWAQGYVAKQAGR